MFRPCILAIVRLHNKLNTAILYVRVVLWGERDLVLQQWVAWPWTAMKRFFVIQYTNALVYYYKHVKFIVQPDDGQCTGPKHVVVYIMYYTM